MTSEDHSTQSQPSFPHVLKSKDRLAKGKHNLKIDLTAVAPGSVWALARHLQVIDKHRVEKESACEVWSCGQNEHGELAHDDKISRATYASAPNLNGRGIDQVSAGTPSSPLAA